MNALLSDLLWAFWFTHLLGTKITQSLIPHIWHKLSSQFYLFYLKDVRYFGVCSKSTYVLENDLYLHFPFSWKSTIIRQRLRMRYHLLVETINIKSKLSIGAFLFLSIVIYELVINTLYQIGTWAIQFIGVIKWYIDTIFVFCMPCTERTGLKINHIFLNSTSIPCFLQVQQKVSWPNLR